MPRFAQLADCLGKSRLPGRVQKTILRDAALHLDTKGGSEMDASKATVQRYHDVVAKDLDSVIEGMKEPEKPLTIPVSEKPTEPVSQSKPAPVPVEKSAAELVKSTTQILHDNGQVKLTVPPGASMIRVTDAKGRQTVERVANVGKGANVLQGAGPYKKVEAGTMATGGKFVPMKGEVLAEPRETIGAANPEGDYRGEHQSPDRESGAPLSKVTDNGIYPDDVYTHKAAQYYGTGDESLDRQSASLIQHFKGRPNAQVKVYRAVPKEESIQDRIDRYEAEKKSILKTGKIPKTADPGPWSNKSAYYDHANRQLDWLKTQPATEPIGKPTVNPGDWVSIIRKYAVDHGQSALNGKYQIISKTVPAKHLFTNGDSWSEWGYDPSTEQTIGAANPLATNDEYEALSDKVYQDSNRTSTEKPKPTPAGRITMEPSIREAYDHLVKETGYPDVPIADLMERVGFAPGGDPMAKAKGILVAMNQKGDATFGGGDWSLSDNRTRAWNIVNRNGDLMENVRLEEPETSIPGLDALHHANLQPRDEDGSFVPGEPDAQKSVQSALDSGDIDRAEYLAAANPAAVTQTKEAMDAMKKRLAPGLDYAGDAAKGLQSLLLPSMKSPEHLAAANVLRTKMGGMNQRQESAVQQFVPARKMFDKLGVNREDLPVSENPGIKFMSDMSTGREMTPEMKAIADRMDKEDANRTDLLEKAGAPMETIRENYFPGIWTNESRAAFNLAMEEARKQGIIGEGTNVNDATPEQKAWVKSHVDEYLKDGKGSGKDALSFLTKSPFKGKESFRKSKVFDKDIKTAFDFGLKAVSNNPVDIKMLKWAEMDRNIMANQALQEWEQKGQMKVAKLSDKIPEGWQKVDDKYGTVYGPQEIEVTAKNSKLYNNDDGSQVSLSDAGLDKLPPDGTTLKVRSPGLQIIGQRIVPDAVGDVLNNYLSSSLYNNKYFGKLYTAWMGTANVLNQSQLGVGSAFHAGFTTAEAQISAVSTVLQDMFGVARGNRTVGQLAKNVKKASIATGETAFTGDKVLNAWRNPGATIDPRIAQVSKAIELAGGGFTMERGMATDQTRKLYSDWYSGKKLRAAMRSPVAAMEMMAHPIMNWLVPRQKAGVFAHMAWRIIEQNPDKSMEELAPQFSAAWNRVDARLGSVRYDRLFINNTAKNMVQGALRAPGWTGGTIAELGGAFKDTYSFFKEWQQTGKVPQDLPPRVAYTAALLLTIGLANAALSYLFTGEKPEGLDYWAFRTGGKDDRGNPERFVLPTYMKDLLAYSKEPLTTLANKQHPILSLIHDLWANKNYYGVKITNEDDGALKKAYDRGKYVAAAFEPFWIRGARKEQQSGNPSLAKTALPLIGITPAPKKMVQSKAEALAEEYRNESLPIGGRTQAQADASSAKADLVKQLRRGEKPDWDSLVKQGVIAQKSIPNLIAQASMTPLQYMVKHLPLDKAEAVLRVANPKEQSLLASIVDAKRQNMAKHNPGNQSLASKTGTSAGSPPARNWFN